MSDKMNTLPFDALLRWVLAEYERGESIFGIHRSLFHRPRADAPYASEIFGRVLATPVGPAAGPHTQLAQNIVCAWLSGSRFIELKTVQIMDELKIDRPCIDMEDEGYNVEWSQELKLDQSAGEYVKAWALLHILRRVLGFEDVPLGTVFNMSVGYNLEGIQSARMTHFMDTLADASEELAEVHGILKAQFPQFADVEIPPHITDNVTVSTMHGCPPDEIERIARYLMEERGLHTIVKLNPTLLGKDEVLRMLHDDLEFTDIEIPDKVFEHDLQYPRAVALIRSLKQTAEECALTFGVKLSNTLAMANHKGYLPGAEMYMSGRALYPITMNLFHKLAREFNGDLNVSYSAGADALNVATILSCGARPVTAASDLLKPGGYSRFLQYLENLELAMRERKSKTLEEFAADKMNSLQRAASDALTDPRYKQFYHPYALPKVASGLGPFDCITAPCVEQCAVCQDVPDYARLIAQGEYDRALEVILSRNPLPGVTGYVCTHLCQTRCTRNNYDEPVAIRALKRFATENGEVTIDLPEATDYEAAIIGSGPSGLAAAYFLALNGVHATVFEAKKTPGGMLGIAPEFRLPRDIVNDDIEFIKALGVDIQLSAPITEPPEELLQQGYDAVYMACGWQKDARLGIEGEDGDGVFAALDFLAKAAQRKPPKLGERVLVIGGGNTAMDAARTAQRLAGHPVTVVYRRTIEEMPAETEEIEDLLAEGNVLEELVSPVRIAREDGKLVGLECVRNELGEPDADGRRKPVPIPGSEFLLQGDSIIVAIGQKPDIAFLNGSAVALGKDGSIAVDLQTGRAGAERVYAGGDAARGPAIIIQACADGRRAAEAICAELSIPFRSLPTHVAALSSHEFLRVKYSRARQEPQRKPEILPVEDRKNFDLIEQTLTEEDARAEAARCLQCSTLCDKCVEVCPNRANYAYMLEPARWTVPVLACSDGKLATVREQALAITQTRQIVHVDDFCNECGNCATFCVHQGKPYADKPRLFLSQADFRQERDNAFHIAGNTIRRRECGQESALTLVSDGMIYEDARVRVALSPGFEVKTMQLMKPFEGELSLVSAAEMAVIWRGVPIRP